MQTKLIEASNNERNWGKFMVMAFGPEELSHASAITGQPLVRETGNTSKLLWVMDIQTREGAGFYTHGVADADLMGHKVWVCPLFPYFLKWLYSQKVTGDSDLSNLPDMVQLPDAPPEFRGYRRPGCADLLLASKSDQAWPTRDAITRVVEFAEKALANDYDGHGWEELQAAAAVVRQALSTAREVAPKSFQAK